MLVSNVKSYPSDFTSSMVGIMMPLEGCEIERNTHNESYSRIIVNNVQLHLLYARFTDRRSNRSRSRNTVRFPVNLYSSLMVASAFRWFRDAMYTFAWCSNKAGKNQSMS
jgi:hypothetical protein